jgi:hypothetical protein
MRRGSGLSRRCRNVSHFLKGAATSLRDLNAVVQLVSNSFHSFGGIKQVLSMVTGAVGQTITAFAARSAPPSPSTPLASSREARRNVCVI